MAFLDTNTAEADKALPTHTHGGPCSRRVLVCVSGMSPAIITETLSALITQPQPWVPHEVHVITTLIGKQQVHTKLLQPCAGAVTGRFQQLLSDYADRLGGVVPRLDDSTVHVIAPKHHPAQSLKDIVTLDDNLAAAQTVYRVLRELKSQPGTQVHASVAGGRKSMSFYMGQAFSLLADEADVLSHVLVSEPFEAPGFEFFYAPPTPITLTDRFGKLPSCHTADARVDLAEMSALKLGPVLRQALPAQALADFDDTMRLAQGLFGALEVRLSVQAGQGKRGKTRGVVSLLGHHVALKPAQFCLLLLHAQAQAMATAGEIERQALKYDAAETDWQNLGAACGLDLRRARLPSATVRSRLGSDCEATVGPLIAARLRVESNNRGRQQLTAQAPTFELSDLFTPFTLERQRLQRLLRDMVQRMAA